MIGGTSKDENGTRSRIRIPDLPRRPEDFLSEIGISSEQVDDKIELLVAEFLKHHGIQSTPIVVSDEASKTHALIIKTASHPWEVLDDSSILSVLSHCKTVRRILFMPLGYPIGVATSGLVSDTRDLASNVKDLVEELADPSLGFLYLQIGPHVKSEILILLARVLRPDVRIIAEFYDMGALFAVDYLTGTRGFNEQDVAITRLAAWAAAQGSGMTIQKADGAPVRRLFDTYESNVFIWNPMDSVLRQSLSEFRDGRSPSTNRNAVDTYTVAFAGSLSDVEITQGTEASPSANMTETLATLMRDERLSVTIFNPADRRDDAPTQERFLRVEAWLNGFGSRHTYKSAIPQERLLNELRHYDFGFFCVHYADTQVQHVGRFAIPNRVMAYLSAGLPVIVDSHASTIAEWISEYNAGIVIDPREFATLPDKICSADRAALRAGAIALCEELVRRNDATRESMMAAMQDRH